MIPANIKFIIQNNCFIPATRKGSATGYSSCKREGFARLHRYIFYLNNHENLTPQQWIDKYKAKVVMHSCDNPPCINPDHLRIGTPLDNAQDRAKKGRSRLRVKIQEKEDLKYGKRYLKVLAKQKANDECRGRRCKYRACKLAATHFLKQQGSRTKIYRCEKHRLYKKVARVLVNYNGINTAKTIDFEKLVKELPKIILVPSLWILEEL